MEELNIDSDIINDKNLLEKAALEVRMKIELIDIEYEYIEEIEVIKEVRSEKGKKIGWTQVNAKLLDGRKQTFYIESKIVKGVNKKCIVNRES